ncbi:MAG: hypothetical protein RJB26_298 [Pseudomonadota bacterium]|jgi:hypothetical protein
MKTMTTPGQQIDGAPKRSGRVRASKASISEPLLMATGQRAPKAQTNSVHLAAANDSRTPLALLEDLHEATSAAIDATGRHNRIAEAAYYRAESRGFSGGCAVTDWLEAEREVDGQLSGRGAEGARCGE